MSAVAVEAEDADADQQTIKPPVATVPDQCQLIPVPSPVMPMRGLTPDVLTGRNRVKYFTHIAPGEAHLDAVIVLLRCAWYGEQGVRRDDSQDHDDKEESPLSEGGSEPGPAPQSGGCPFRGRAARC